MAAVLTIPYDSATQQQQHSTVSSSAAVCIVPGADDGHVDELHRGGQHQGWQAHGNEKAALSSLLQLTLAQIAPVENKRPRPRHLSYDGKQYSTTVPYHRTWRRFARNQKKRACKHSMLSYVHAIRMQNQSGRVEAPDEVSGKQPAWLLSYHTKCTTG